MIIPFGTQSYQHRSRSLASQRMLNCYLEVAPPAAKTPAAVVPAFGVAPFVEVGDGPIRGGIVCKDVLYVVSGTQLYRVNSAGIVKALGSIPSLDRVFMVEDGTNIFIATAGRGFVYNGSSVTEITDLDFPGARAAAFLDGYVIVVEPHSGRFFTSESVYTPDAWNALDFATAEGAPDDLVSVLVDHREVFLFGTQSTEVWYNKGNADFPLERTPSGYIEVGCLSTHGPAKIDNSVFFPANDFTVRRLEGYTPIRVSTHAMEQAIESYTDKTCYGMTWTEGGHSFYGLTFAEATWVYDASTQLWHERQSYGLKNWRPAFALRAYQRVIVGDARSNKLGFLDPETFTEWDQPMVASCTSPAVAEENRIIQHARLELVFEAGVGLQTGQGSDPQVMLDWSNDGGRTWSNEHWRSLGAIGRYKTRVFWNRLGQARDRVYRYSISDPVRRTLIQAVLDAA